MLEIIKTIPEKCVQCYACVRNCPVKAVAIHNGKARIIQERCIQCGNCVNICSQNAKRVLTGIEAVANLLEQKDCVALVAPSFPAVYENNTKYVASALRSIGFKKVYEVAIGAELIAQEYQRLNFEKQCYISTACPAVINLIQKHYPEFTSMLAPIVSPAIATARLVKHLNNNKPMKYIFIGPCIAKKSEINQSSVQGEIDYALTYKELDELFDRNNIDWSSLKHEKFDGPCASLAYAFPISGGLLRNLNRTEDLLQEDCLKVEGIVEWIDAFELLKEADNPLKFIDGLFCRGCIDGPSMQGKGNILKRKTQILKYIKSIPIDNQAAGKAQLLNVDINLSRTFEDLFVPLPIPDEETINIILKQTDKFKPCDQMNCGACGYNSCREKAIAVYQGIAERDMCLPYLLNKKTELLESLNGELNRIKDLNDELDIIINSSYDGICMSDAFGNIQRVNKGFRELLNMNNDQLIGKNLQDLEIDGIIKPSATMMAIREAKTVTFVQQLNTGKRVLATGNPVLNDKGRVVRVITNIRDFDKLYNIQNQLQKVHISNESTQKNKNLIYLSEEMKKVVDMAQRVAIVDTTVLIEGESGVGKDVLARHIHNSSTRSKKPFVKISCGSLPEALIESELFGYETGAFTGAKKQGKAGLFEAAHGGTIFLDEIGELPLSQQVKLLQVIQDRQIMRIGGTKPKRVNVRVVAATNRELKNMVKKGNFRADLFYRLNVVPIRVPPLRDRRDDILPLMYHFLELFSDRYSKDCKLTNDFKNALVEYYWPGNVRELQNMMERLVVISKTGILDVDDLKQFILHSQTTDKAVSIQSIVPLKYALAETERQLLEKAKKVYGSTYKIAEVLKVNQSTIVRKLNKYNKEN